MRETIALLEKTDFPPLTRSKVETMQVNLGYRCNQQCLHCHVNAGPKRKENMERETVEQLLAFLGASKIKKLDLTGGAPELNPNFRYLVTEARKLGVHVIDRCNLTVLFEPGQEDLAEFLAENRVEVVASLPCYLKANVDRQRGKGVFEASTAALKKLNRLGYGKSLTLNIMYNPQGPSLPPSQEKLEADYREHLQQEHGIIFSNLYTLTNMPIKRFGSTLISKGQFDAYMQLLRDNFSQDNLDNVMCRTLISIDWQGYVYDCDFNQMLGLPATLSNKPRTHIKDLMNNDLEGKPIVVKDHCYGCTAGQGSSCGGAL
jgi:radical SAM/Cys-rich protein